MATVLRIPTQPQPSQFLLALGEELYSITLQYANVDEGGWFISIADSNGVDLVSGIALVTGCNLLGQYEYLGIGTDGAILFTYTDGASGFPPPTYENLGTQGNIYYEVPDGA